MDLSTIEQLNNIFEMVTQQNTKMHPIWFKHIFLSWRWWISVSFLIVPWLIWLKIRKKDSTDRLLVAGFVTYLIASVLNSIGLAHGVWVYPVTPLPYLHTYFGPWDITLLPITVMVFLQYKPTISPYIKALLFSFLTAFVGEPFFVYIDLYIPYGWKYSYSLSFFFFIYLIAHWISRRTSTQLI
jgi:hypothetical protein